jgi:hypothetical protein
MVYIKSFYTSLQNPTSEVFTPSLLDPFYLEYGRNKLTCMSF